MSGWAIAGALGADLIGSEMNRKSRSNDRKMQYDFAQHGVQWRVEDAKRAGIHPLAALGMSPNQASPVMVGSDPGGPLRRMANKMYDAQMQESVMRGDESKAKANYYNAMAENIRNPVVTTGDGNLVGNEEIVKPGVVQNKPQELVMPYNGNHKTGKSVPQERIEQEYGGVLGELYGIVRGATDFVIDPGLNWRDKMDRKIINDIKKFLEKHKSKKKGKYSNRKKTGQMNRRRK